MAKIKPKVRSSMMVDKDFYDKFKACCYATGKKPNDVMKDIMSGWMRKSNKKLQEVTLGGN